METQAINDLLKNFDYAKAAVYYQAHGPKGFLKEMISKGHTQFNEAKLKEALKKMAVSEATPSGKVIQEVHRINKEAEKPKVEKEKYSFSITDPHEVHALNKEWKKYYGEKNLLRLKLRSMASNEERKLACIRIAELRKRTIDIWKKLDHFQIHKTLPAEKKLEYKLDQVSPIELTKIVNRLRRKISGYRNNPKQIEKVAQMKEELKVVLEAIENAV